MLVTCTDAIGVADVHNYRVSLIVSHDIPLGEPLSSIWRPDGRTTDPEQVLDTDTPTGFLGDFVNYPPDGQWTLFVADLAPVGEVVIESWSFGFVTATMPEPAEIALGFGLGMLAWAVRRRHS